MQSREGTVSSWYPRQEPDFGDEKRAEQQGEKAEGRGEGRGACKLCWPDRGRLEHPAEVNTRNGDLFKEPQGRIIRK